MKTSHLKKADSSTLSVALSSFRSRPSSAKADPVLRRRRLSQVTHERVSLNATMPDKATSPVDDSFLNTVCIPRVPRVQLKLRHSASFQEEQLGTLLRPAAVELAKGQRKVRKPRKKKVCWRTALPYKESAAKGFYPRIVPMASETIFDFQAILNVTNGKLIF